ncbi:hypothetical protein ACVRWG_04825 [Streptococcus uberis]|uniref:hypothetical protein n=1 Tax=Streptococcus uberis TaxID=1349 RepID=UPI0005433D66|nr:hypothetical protein [Streptococcus uberis]KHD39064.1 hypothetical protein NA32_09670 [Streptococcus hongkongensis]SQG46699.1 Uncharacterised protein [Streptococcus uberis]
MLVKLINKLINQKSGLVNSSAAFLKELAKAKITDKVVETFTKESWEALSKNFQTMQLSGVLTTVNGVELATAIDVNPSYANFIRESSKFVKYGAPVIGAAVDFGLQLKYGEDVGESAVKTGVHSAIGLASVAVGGPTGFIIGVGVSMVFDFEYDNYKDNIFDSVNNFANNLGTSVND